MAGMTIGFIGQGFIGKAYADDYEARGFSTVRYAKEEPYTGNKDAIKECDIVLVAVPTPTTPKGFDSSIVEEVLQLVGKGKIAVIKSTLLPGTSEKLQEMFPEITVLHSPEFLRARSAREDVKSPDRNIIGISKDTPEQKKAAEEVLKTFPTAPYNAIVSSRESELIKYAGNVFLAMKVIFANMLHDLSKNLGTDYETVRAAFGADPRIGSTHLTVNFEGGRGAGGYCFIKDFAAFNTLYEKFANDPQGFAALKGFEMKNKDLLLKSGKDLELLKGVYGAL
jgi:nucleotide sugar dehydrogenase